MFFSFLGIQLGYQFDSFPSVLSHLGISGLATCTLIVLPLHSFLFFMFSGHSLVQLISLMSSRCIPFMIPMHSQLVPPPQVRRPETNVRNLSVFAGYPPVSRYNIKIKFELKVAGDSFQYFSRLKSLMGHYNHSILVDTNIMVSTNCTIIGE